VSDRVERSGEAPPHETEIAVEYACESVAAHIVKALAPEVGQLDESRSQVSLTREASTVRVRIRAGDLTALRAGMRSWSRLLAVTERVLAHTT